jgi:hypothetical protein
MPRLQDEQDFLHQPFETGEDDEKDAQAGLRQRQWLDGVSPPEEQSLTEFIRNQVLIPDHIFQNADLRAYAIAAWFEKYRDNEHAKHFN